MKTDTSEDDDYEFVVLDEGEAPAFSHPHLSDTTSSTDDDLSSVFAESTSASKTKEYVSTTVKQKIFFKNVGREISNRASGKFETCNALFLPEYNWLTNI